MGLGRPLYQNVFWLTKITLHSAELQKGTRAPQQTIVGGTSTWLVRLKGITSLGSSVGFWDPEREKASGGQLQPHGLEPLWFSRSFRLSRSAHPRS